MISCNISHMISVMIKRDRNYSPVFWTIPAIMLHFYATVQLFVPLKNYVEEHFPLSYL